MLRKVHLMTERIGRRPDLSTSNGKCPVRVATRSPFTPRRIPEPTGGSVPCRPFILQPRAREKRAKTPYGSQKLAMENRLGPLELNQVLPLDQNSLVVLIEGGALTDKLGPNFVQ
jgi:hypothetical protein